MTFAGSNYPPIYNSARGIIKSVEETGWILRAWILYDDYNKKQDCLSRVVMAKRHRRKTANIKL
jgi:hypothetical protein